MATSNNQVELGQHIGSRACPQCYLCSIPGESLYHDLTDRLFGAPGEWNLKRCPNAECGLIWLDPMPLPTDIHKAYKKYFTHQPLITSSSRTNMLRRTWMRLESAYLAYRFKCGKCFGRRFESLLALPIILSRIDCDALDIPMQYLANRATGRMLDVGCGNASVVKLAQDLGWNAEGVDVDPQAIEDARCKGLVVHLGELDHINYHQQSFDLVLMNNVIEHVDNPLQIITEVKRILRPGGRLVVTTPNTASWGHRRFASDWVHLDPPRHLRLFNATNLRRLIERVGFTVHVRSSLRLTPLAFVASRAIHNTKRGNPLRLSGLSAELRGRAGSIFELLIRLWDPFAGDELIVEADK